MAYNPEEARYYEKEIRAILSGQWNPVKTSARREVKTEYLAYAGRIYRKLISDDPASSIFEFLWDIETKEMCLAGDESHTREITAAIMNLRKGSLSDR